MQILYAISDCMDPTSQIVSGGGWKDARSVRVEIKAWAALFVSLGLGGIALNASHSGWVIGIGIVAIYSLSASIRLFVRSGGKHDLRKLYGMCDGAMRVEQKDVKEGREIEG